jgi:hypothetical protein
MYLSFLLSDENAPFLVNIFKKHKSAPVAGLTPKNVPKSIQKCAMNLCISFWWPITSENILCVTALKGVLKNCIRKGLRCHKGRLVLGARQKEICTIFCVKTSDGFR